MKKISIKLLLFIITVSCNNKIENTKTNGLDVFKSKFYEGYYLKSLQINDDSTYRISLFNKDKVEVIISVQSSEIEFKNNDTINAVYRQIINGLYTGKYIISLKSDFKITNYNL